MRLRRYTQGKDSGHLLVQLTSDDDAVFETLRSHDARVEYEACGGSYGCSLMNGCVTFDVDEVHLEAYECNLRPISEGSTFVTIEYNDDREGGLCVRLDLTGDGWQLNPVIHIVECDLVEWYDVLDQHLASMVAATSA